MLSTVRAKLRPFFLEHLPGSVRTTLLEDTASFLLQKSLLTGVDCDYGKSVLHLLYLLLSPEVKSPETDGRNNVNCYNQSCRR